MFKLFSVFAVIAGSWHPFHTNLSTFLVLPAADITWTCNHTCASSFQQQKLSLGIIWWQGQEKVDTGWCTCVQHGALACAYSVPSWFYQWLLAQHPWRPTLESEEDPIFWWPSRSIMLSQTKESKSSCCLTFTILDILGDCRSKDQLINYYYRWWWN